MSPRYRKARDLDTMRRAVDSTTSSPRTPLNKRGPRPTDGAVSSLEDAMPWVVHSRYRLAEDPSAGGEDTPSTILSPRGPTEFPDVADKLPGGTESSEQGDIQSTPSIYDRPKPDPKHTSPMDSSRIHGNWCGPGWTGGAWIPAGEYAQAGGDWNAPAIDALDAACRAHDKGCANGGCSTQDDKRLANQAIREVISKDSDSPAAVSMAVATMAGGASVIPGFRNDSDPVELDLEPRTPFYGGDPFMPFWVHDVGPMSEDSNLGKWGRTGNRQLRKVIKNAGDKAGKWSKAYGKYIPVVGVVSDVDMVADVVDEHGWIAPESQAAMTDAVVNQVPIVGQINDIYSIVTGSDGFFQDVVSWAKD